MKLYQMPKLSLLLVVCLIAVSGSLGPLFARAEQDLDAPTTIDIGADFEADVIPDEPIAEVDEKDVVVLTEKNFNATVLAAPYALVEFYAPWCGHCKTLKPEYAKAATALKAQFPTIVIGKVDATEEPDIAARYGVNGYPTLKWFVDGKALDFGGAREADGIVQWVARKLGPPADTLTSETDLTNVQEQIVIVIGYFKKFEGAAYDAFQGMAKNLENMAAYQTMDASVALIFNLTAPGVVLMRNYKGHPIEAVPFTEEAVTSQALLDFVETEKLPLFLEFNDENQPAIFGSGISVNVLMVGTQEQIDPDSEVVKSIRFATRYTKGKAIYSTVLLGGPNAEALTDFFGLKSVSEEVQVVAFNAETSQKFKMYESLTRATLTRFAESIIDGSLKPDVKSGEIPTGADAKDGDVVVVVGKSFDAIVLDDTKDVLLEVYAPWCGHCKDLAPIYRKLGKRFRDIDSVVIAKVDGTENEHEKLDVEGFPTLLLFPAGKNGTFVTFEGDYRGLKTLTQFIKQHGTVAFELPTKVVEREDAEEEAANAAAAAEAAAKEAEEEAGADSEEDIAEAKELLDGAAPENAEVDAPGKDEL